MSSHARSVPTRNAGVLARFVVAVAGAASRSPRRTIAAWLVGITLLVVLGALSGTQMLSDAALGTGESERADTRLAAAGLAAPAGESVLVQSSSAATTSAVVQQLQRRLAALPVVASVDGPAQVPQLSAEGGRTALVQVVLHGGYDRAVEAVAPVSRAVTSVAAAHPDVRVSQAGDGSGARAVQSVLDEDLHRVELVSLPLTLLVLLAVFGSAVAAAVPLLFGLTCVAGALGAMGLLSHLVPVSGSASTLLVLIGLAVGVDYSLFLIRRERAERRAGAGADAALAAAVAGTSRAIVVAGTTVAIALAGLVITGMAMFVSMALATVVVVAIAVVGSLTVLPAVLALLGDRLEAGRLRLPHPRTAVWARICGAVARRPVAAVVTSVAILVALAAPAVDLRTGDPGIDDMPTSVAVVAASHRIEAAFPSASGQDQLVVEGTHLDLPASRAALARLGTLATATARGSGAASVRVSADRRTAVIDVPVPDSSAGAVARLRASAGHDLADRPGLAALRGARVLVTGSGAGDVDFSQRLHDRTPLTVAAVLFVALVLLLLSFGSLPLALAVTGLNLLSVGAAYGVLTAVFQRTWAASALGFTPTGAVVTWVPLFAFVILFGLSMDYTVLVLEHIHQARAGGLSPRRAAVTGVGATGGTVTAAAAVMVVVFGLFASLRLVEFKELGVGLAAAVVVDATLVRAVALPAVVCLLGRRGWRVPADPRPAAAPVARPVAVELTR